MSRKKIPVLLLTLLLAAALSACGNPISEIVHGDAPSVQTPDVPDDPTPEPEPEPEETEEERRARLIKKMEDIFAAAEHHRFAVSLVGRVVVADVAFLAVGRNEKLCYGGKVAGLGIIIGDDALPHTIVVFPALHRHR